MQELPRMIRKNIILLTGFMAAGKTTAGRAAADILGLPFIDLDQKIEEAAGLTISSLFASQGEAFFRQLEARLFAEVSCESQKFTIVAAGGGLPMQPINHPGMQNCHVIFIDTPWEIIAERLNKSPRRRPLFNDSEPDAARALWEKRHPVYLKLADFVIKESDQLSELIRQIITGATNDETE